MLKTSLVTIVFSLFAIPAIAATNYSPQNLLIGVTPSVQASANNGAGITIGVIDTGGTSSWVGFQGYNGNKTQGIISGVTCISPCSSNMLKSGNTDDNGHGTFVTSEIIGGIPSAGMVGVAPAANVLAVKVLNSQGSGNSNDVANGIIYAANHGASVINMSLGPSGTAAQQAAFYQSIASAVNYAASKNMVVVFAGGNAAQAFSAGANITGFTDAAIQNMIFVGSTNAQQVKSSFSNTPGSAGFVSTTGKFYAYDTRWVMADGENIWGASNYSTTQYGYGYITQMSGTSMAAPQAAGVAALLASRWSFLITKGLIPTIIEQTAQDLGAKGVDTIYGNGFLRADLAMNPIGSLTVPINGKNVVVSASQILSGAALGNVGTISSALKNVTGYDYYNRNFPLSITSAIVNKNTVYNVSLATSQVTGTTASSSRSFTDAGNGNWFTSSFTNLQTGQTTINRGSYTVDPNNYGNNEWAVGFSENGNYVGAGQGSGAALSFNDARWGGSDNNAFFNDESTASGSLLKLANGANFAATGIQINKKANFAVAMLSSSDNSISNGTSSSVKGAAIAYTFEPHSNWKISITSSLLKEDGMMLGSYSSGILGLSPSNTSKSFGIGTNIGLGDGYQLGLDSTYVITDPSSNANSLITSTSKLQSMALSAALAKNDLTTKGDRLSLFLDKPLRVYSGNANLTVPSGNDINGNSIITSAKASLVPNGSETDLGFNYKRPISDDSNIDFRLTYRNDADNISGARDAAAMATYKFSF